MSTQTLNRPDQQVSTGQPWYSHLVAPFTDERGNILKTGVERVMEARLMGTTVTALCGFRWVPQRDPANHPPCPKCVEILDSIVKDKDHAWQVS